MKKIFTILTLFFAITVTSKAQNINDSLVAFYPFDGNANDASGKNHNGTVNGATLTTDRFGNTNKAYEFDGVNDYIEISNGSLLDLDYKFSLSFWFYQTDNANNGFRILDKNTAGQDDGYGVDTYGNGTGTELRLYFKNQLGTPQASHGLSVWNHGVITYDSLKLKFYLNGLLENTINITGNNAPANTLPLLIGCGQNGTNRQNFFEGKIDDIRIYRRTLDSSAVKMLHMGPITSVAEIETAQTVLYPNPTLGKVFLTNGYEVIKIVDVLGRDISYSISASDKSIELNNPGQICFVYIRNIEHNSIHTIKLLKN